MWRRLPEVGHVCYLEDDSYPNPMLLRWAARTRRMRARKSVACSDDAREVRALPRLVVGSASRHDEKKKFMSLQSLVDWIGLFTFEFGKAWACQGRPSDEVRSVKA